MVILLATPPVLSSDVAVLPTEVASVERVDEHGHHFHHPLANGQHLTLLRLADVPSDQSLVAVVPLDLDGFGRIEAVTRLLSALHGRSVPPDTRLTRQQLQRARRMLQAVDGHMSGASHRDIAEVLFGARRLADEPWKTSSHRFAVMNLIKGGLTMISGDYRRLLSHRRRR